jgi:predicted nucleic acid-binding protein
MVENKVKVVLDASVILKWFLNDEENQEEALDLRLGLESKEYEVFIPSHCLTEICNTLFRKKPDFALQVFSILRTMEFKDCLLSIPLAAEALRLVLRHPKVSFYDVFYHAIAINNKIPFITADEKYYKAVGGEKSIVLLRDYKTR